jgi:hypothetical protein
VQNPASLSKRIERCAIGLGYAVGIHVFGGANKAQFVDIDDCVIWNPAALSEQDKRACIQIYEEDFFDDRLMMQFYGRTQGCRVRRCLLLNAFVAASGGYRQDGVQIGYHENAYPDISATIEDCLIFGKINLQKEIENLTVTGNTFVIREPDDPLASVKQNAFNRDEIAALTIKVNEPRTNPYQNRVVHQAGTNEPTPHALKPEDIRYLIAASDHLPGRQLLASLKRIRHGGTSCRLRFSIPNGRLCRLNEKELHFSDADPARTVPYRVGLKSCNFLYCNPDASGLHEQPRRSSQRA